MPRYRNACLAVLVLSTSAAAQELLPVQESEIELAGYADCVVSQKAYRKPVEAFLRTVPDSADFFPASMKAADMKCLNAAAVRRRASKLEMRLQPATFRDALYPALYRRSFGKTGPVQGIASAAPLNVRVEFVGDAGALAPDYAAGRAVGDCVARSAPAAAHAMLMAKPYSKAEDAAAQSLAQPIAACVPEGQTVQVNRSSIRAITGEAIYKLSMAASGKTG